MTPNDKMLAAKLLRLAAERFGNHVCNDFDLRKAGINDPAEWLRIDREAHERNGDPHEHDPNNPREIQADFVLMYSLADALEEDSKR